MERAASADLWLDAAAKQFGTPCYVYDLMAIERRIHHLRRAFGGRFSISFAVKCNPNRALLEWLSTQIDHLDVSSIGEYRIALAGARDKSVSPDRESERQRLLKRFPQGWVSLWWNRCRRRRSRATLPLNRGGDSRY
jgi:diaminopimelate decarboxylase